MDKLWAPWRIGYIKKTEKQKGGCLFCRVVKSKKDKKNLLLYRSRHAFAILNKYPYNNGHLMVCPYTHTKDLSCLKAQEVLDLHRVLNKMVTALRQTLHPEGFNIGINVGKIAGAGIPGHVHIHIVPRWSADTNFMPVISGTKVISQSLEELYGQLHRAI